ncbi:hypothetical protein SPV1_02202 [Mariprofundus ferrooxydans PV-1]|uniref:Uncharacterized protein n=1 Tax=Mariprofundus ferrooxydans PV-1 TaxID=314345 RepID=Q0F228_9PROT|nr:hypothetical protein SPV1_02202 [Mariprofundus ferrooxydans PV-1]
MMFSRKSDAAGLRACAAQSTVQWQQEWAAMIDVCALPVAY